MEKNEGLLDQLKQRLKQRYRENTNIKRLFYPEHPLPLNKSYIHLGLIPQHAFHSFIKNEDQMIISNPIADENSNEFNDSMDLEESPCLNDSSDEEDSIIERRIINLTRFERIAKIKKKIEVADIVKTYLPENKRILIEGPAGSGKTTMCRYIAYQWALGEESNEPWAKQYDWLFWIPLRELILFSNNTQVDLLKVLRHVCFKFTGLKDDLRNEKNQELFLEALAQVPNRILFLLDGYDELDLQNPTTKMLLKELQNSEQILLTTRPGRPITFDPPIKLHLSVLGLSDEQIDTYVEDFFEHVADNPEINAEAFNDFIENDLNLWSLAHSRINLEMLCTLWDQKILNRQMDINLTDLYRLIVEHLLLRYVKNLQPDEIWTTGSAKQHCQTHIQFMEYIAFLAMQKEEVFIQESSLIDQALKYVNKNKISDKNFLGQVQALGLINFYREGQQAEFAHLTFQEFFAARYIKKQLLVLVESQATNLVTFKPIIQFIYAKKHEPFYEVIWWFVAGLLAQKPAKPFLIDIEPKQNVINDLSRNQLKLQALQLWIDCILQPPRSGKNELIEVCLLMRYLDEAKYSQITQKSALISLFEHWLKITLENYYQILTASKEIKEQLNLFISCIHKSSISLFQVTSIYEFLYNKLTQKHDDSLDDFLGALTELDLWQILVRVKLTEAQLNNGLKPISVVILELLGHKNKEVILAAVEAVSTIKTVNPDLQAALLPLLKKQATADKKDTDICLAAINAVGNISSDLINEIQNKLLSLTKNANKQIRLAAIEVLIEDDYEGLNEFKRLLLQLMDDEEKAIRYAAIEIFRSISAKKDIELQQKLIQTLQVGNKSQYLSAMKSMQVIGKRTTIELQHLVLPLLANQDEALRSAALEAVHAFRASTTRDFQLSVRFLLNTENKANCITGTKVIKALGAYTINELQCFLLPLLLSNEKEVAITAIKAVSAIGAATHREIQLALCSSLKSPDGDIRKRIIDAIRSIGMNTIVELQRALVPLFDVNDPQLCYEILKVIVSIGKKTIVDLQLALLPSLVICDERIPGTAVIAIGAIGIAASEQLKAGLQAICADPNVDDSLKSNVFSCLASVYNDIGYLKQGFKINTLQLPPSQIFNWTKHSITQLMPLCGEMQKPILQTGEVQHVLTADYWTLALVRKKDHQHVFLVLEGLENNIHFATKIELVNPNNSSISSFNQGLAKIEVTTIEDFNRLQALSENCECQTYSITAKIGNQLIGNAKVDQEAKICYNYLGDGRVYSFSFFNKERHNCLSWCLKQLQAVGIPLKRHWLDVVCVLAENYLPSTNQEISSSRCLIS